MTKSQVAAFKKLLDNWASAQTQEAMERGDFDDDRMNKFLCNHRFSIISALELVAR